MSTLLPFVVAGVVSGAIYGLAATGLVLTYKTSGIFNFGHGALATAAAYCFYWMHVDRGWDWKLAAFVSVVVIGTLMGLAMERIARALARQRTAWKIVGTVGLILLVQGLGSIKYGTDSLRVPQYLPKGNDAFRIFDVNVRWGQVTVATIAVVAVIALYLLFRLTRLGLAMRAVVDDPDLVDLQGTDPIAVRRISWILGSMLASLSGVLIIPFVGLESITLTFLVVQAFGAAAVGMFASIPLTFVGGIGIGVGEALLTKYEISNPVLNGVSRGLPFIVLVVVMLVTPRERLAPSSAAEARPALQWQGPIGLRLGVGVIVFGLLATVPMWAEAELAPYWIGALTTAIIMLSLGLLVRTAGIVSLCTAGFAAVGATTFSQLAVGLGIPWLPAILIAGLVAVPVGALVAIPSLRLSGLFLALSTLGLGLLLERVFYSKSYMFTVLAQGRRVPRPSIALSNSAYYYVVLAFVLGAVVVIALIQRGRLGRILLGMAESPQAVATLGQSVNTSRVIVFCIGAYMAAVAGALHGGMLGVAGAESSVFSSFNSIVLVAVLALAPFRAPWYAIFAGLTQVIPAYIDGEHTGEWLTVIFGAAAIVIAAQGGPIGMPERLRTVLDARFRRSARSADPPASSESIRARMRRPEPNVAAGGIAGLQVDQLAVRFGGLSAVDGVSLAAPMGRITGLIGPNGAGKTTTFNACSGLNKPTEGRILLHGHDVSSHSPPRRARQGLGRTFQIMELCESLTVAENVALGRESSQSGARVISQVFATPEQSRIRQQATFDAMELCGIANLADRQAGALSTGERRLVELARCLAGPFDVLLLDEPSSGLDHDETARFGEILSTVVEERGCGVLLVEHDMALVMGVCSYLHVLDFGKLIFEGTPAQVAASEVVQAAYLGSESSEPDGLERTRATPEPGARS